MSRYSVGRRIANDIIKRDRRRTTYTRLQKEAAARTESRLVKTPIGEFWMSPIEAELYDAMRKEDLHPIPQYCVKGYYVDFAFPDVGLAVEADGAAYHTGGWHERDKKRDAIIRRTGWTVKRFQGTTIHNKAANCAYIIKQEVVTRRTRAEIRIKQEQAKRQKQRDALTAPFRKFRLLLLRDKGREGKRE